MTIALMSAQAAQRGDADRESPIERLELLAGDDGAIAQFLDELDVTSPREREMLAELAHPARSVGLALANGFRFSSWWVALLVGLAGALIGLALSWIVLRGTAMAGKRIRLAVRDPVAAVWESLGNCGTPPRDQSRKFAIVVIGLTVGGWIVLPTLVALSLAT